MRAKDESEPGSYFVFDTFNDEAAREAHMNGEAGKEFVANKDRLFSEVKIHRESGGCPEVIITSPEEWCGNQNIKEKQPTPKKYEHHCKHSSKP